MILPRRRRPHRSARICVYVRPTCLLLLLWDRIEAEGQRVLAEQDYPW